MDNQTTATELPNQARLPRGPERRLRIQNSATHHFVALKIERTIDDIKPLKEMVGAPDIRPVSAGDLAGFESTARRNARA
jgi:hypothetical protein